MPKPEVDYSELVVRLLRNSDSLDLHEQPFKDAIGSLSNVRRCAVYDYVGLLKDRISLVEQMREASRGPCRT
jgi:hypothetical protein